LEVMGCLLKSILLPRLTTKARSGIITTRERITDKVELKGSKFLEIR